MSLETGKAFPKVWAMTLNWNRKEETIQCVDSLQALNYANFEILVIDNGSDDGSAAAVRERFPDVAVLENGRNLGYAEGFNAGMQYASERGADYFLIMNNDAVIDPDALTALVDVAETDSQIGFVSGKVYFHNDPNRLQTVGRTLDPVFIVFGLLGNGELDEGQYDETRDCDFVDDVFLLVRRSVYDLTGGYDPIFFLMYEETDWCARVRRAGYRIVYTPDAKLWHQGCRDNTTGISTTHQYYLARNQIPFVYRNATRAHFRRYLCVLLTSYAPRRVWRFAKRGQFGLLAAYLRGIASGLGWVARA